MPTRPFKLFAGSASRSLGESLSQALGCTLASSLHSSLPNGDPYFELNEPLAGANVYLLQSLPSPASWHLLELLLMADTARREGAQYIEAIIPYYSYGRQDKAEGPGKPLAARTVAKLLTASGINKVVLLHAHSPQVSSLFDSPVVELSPVSLFAEQIRQVANSKELSILAADPSALKIALNYAEELGAQVALALKKRQDAYTVQSKDLLGKIQGKHVWIVDDCLCTGQTLLQAVQLARQQGALSVSAAITHLDPSPVALQELKALGLAHLLTTDSCELPLALPAKRLSLGPVFKSYLNSSTNASCR